MNNKLLWCVVGLLTCACVGEGYYIYSQKKDQRPAPLDLLAEQEKWMSEAKKNLFKGAPIPFRQFDDLFNDDFFGRKFDPFTEIESFQKRINPFFNDEEKPLLGRSWSDWFQNRMDVADLRPEVKTTGDQVILSFKIPGLKGESFNVNANEDRIRIAYDAKITQDKKDEKGAAYFKSESVRHFEKIMPIPKDADPLRNRIVREGNIVKLIFQKRSQKTTGGS